MKYPRLFLGLTNEDDMNSNRTIFAISVVAEIFEKLNFEQLYEYLNNSSLISASQSGFRTSQIVKIKL